MLQAISPLGQLRSALRDGITTPIGTAAECIACANASRSRNTYLHFDTSALLSRAELLKGGPLYGAPISLKDCFDFAGTVTTCGSRFYARQNAVATEDSTIAKALRKSGALITGKTHLHPLAYGITGQNPEYGDCLQPRDARLLTGGSSSGAAASVQEGSALAAIGTDTGGSIRVPAALCGLVGYRASHALARQEEPDLWAGASNLAPSFDTPGFLARDPRDLATLASALFGVPPIRHVERPRIGFVHEPFLVDANSDVMQAYTLWRGQLAQHAASVELFDPESWSASREIFAGIQASEAAAIHAGNFDQFEPAITQRLHWGASLRESEVAELRQRLADFRVCIARLFAQYDLLALPCAPVNRLFAAADQSQTRAAILRYTTPFSLAGLPVVALPGEMIGGAFGTGIQIAAAAGEDASLLAFAGSVAQHLVSGGSQ